MGVGSAVSVGGEEEVRHEVCIPGGHGRILAHFCFKSALKMFLSVLYLSISFLQTDKTVLFANASKRKNHNHAATSH